MMQTRIVRSQPRFNIYLQSELKCQPSIITTSSVLSPLSPPCRQYFPTTGSCPGDVITIGASGNITITRQKSHNSTIMGIPVQTEKLLTLCRNAIPKMSSERHKGQYGRIGVVGGSLEYTGAPYFAAISALRVGADLAHVFCQQEAAVVIKSYSPELIVHPLLDRVDAIDLITPWLQRLHVLIIGPGLGRSPSVQKTVTDLLKVCLQLEKPVIIDADGLSLLVGNMSLISGQKNVILTPNAIEFQRLFGERSQGSVTPAISKLGTGVLVLEKGAHDYIHILGGGPMPEVYSMPSGGSGRRCGGQGDLLSGALAVLFHWCLESKQVNAAFLATFAASLLIKECNAEAFKKQGRGMLASDMLLEIPATFAKIFDAKN